jgi:hypothetical protein
LQISSFKGEAMIAMSMFARKHVVPFSSVIDASVSVMVTCLIL